MDSIGLVLPNGRQVNAPIGVWLAALLQSLGETRLVEICNIVETHSQAAGLVGGSNGVPIISGRG